jgi:cytochrome b involved in lipid metabolism
MKKLSTISLFIFGVVVIAILVAGLVFYQNKKGIGQVATNSLVKNAVTQAIQNNNPTTTPVKSNPVSSTNNTVKNTTTPVATAPVNSIVLNIQEISKHNSKSSCWLLISGKVYDITSYFGSHPGGNNTMTPTCGADATAAYNTQDPYATSSSSSSAHSSRAKNMLSSYYLGDLNQSISL